LHLAAMRPFLWLLAASLTLALAYTPAGPALCARQHRRGPFRSRLVCCDVVSPFDPSATASAEPSARGPITGPLPLTPENVELVLEEMRPYLLADGGNVELKDIDGATVVLELQGACGSCPSSSMTMKFGLERGLREKIPEILAVEQVSAEGALLTEEAVEEVLEEIRPFLKIAGGGVEMVDMDPAGVQPSVTLRMTGSGAMIKSVRGEVLQRLRNKIPTLAGVLWDDPEWKNSR